MTSRMDFYQLNWKIHELIDGLALRMNRDEIEQIRESVEYNEQGMAVDDLVGLLLADRTPVHPEERAALRELFDHFGPVPGDFMPNVFNSGDVLGVLDKVEPEDSPLPPRGTPRLRGGHEPGAGRLGATTFPRGWSVARIQAAGSQVLRSTDTTTLANRRVWGSGSVDGVRVGVLAADNGSLRQVFPLRTEHRARGFEFADKQQPQLAELLGHDIALACTAVVRSVSERLQPYEVEILREIHLAGELEELADVLAAGLTSADAVYDDRLYRAARRMLCGFDLPVPGCDYINDRATVLARLRVA